jgi:heme A synthase
VDVWRLIRAVIGFFAAVFGVGLLVNALAAEALAVAGLQVAAGLVLLAISLVFYRSLAPPHTARRN